MYPYHSGLAVGALLRSFHLSLPITSVSFTFNRPKSSFRQLIQVFFDRALLCSPLTLLTKSITCLIFASFSVHKVLYNRSSILTPTPTFPRKSTLGTLWTNLDPKIILIMNLLTRRNLKSSVTFNSQVSEEYKSTG